MLRLVGHASHVFGKQLNQGNTPAFSLGVHLVKNFSQNSSVDKSELLRSLLFQYVQTRNTNFFNKHSAKNIWAGVTGVSNAGKKRGRGRGPGKIMSRDLNKGQIIGVGKTNIVWPGLSAPVIRGREIVRQTQLPPDPERQAKLIALRDRQSQGKKRTVAPLERGWSGGKAGGRSLGPPDPVGENTFDGFDTRILEYKAVFCMKKNSGRYRTVSTLVVTGNGQGLAGFALGKSVDGKSSMRNAKNRAGQKLIYVDRYKNHTVMHDFFTQFGRTKIYVEKKPEGHGLICQRIIAEICKAVGIKDIYAKIEGSTNPQAIVKSFFLGLMQQKSHQQLAEEQQLHLVEFSQENDNYPTIVASPTHCKDDSSKAPDFTEHVMGNRVVAKKKKWLPFYKQLEHNPYWPNLELKIEKVRSHEATKVNLIAEHGKLASFLTEKHPECQTYHTMPDDLKEKKED
uniref:Small ribosomal subunit protein uS5m n=1 Tax=Cacopsylla melanoneura TaxID=428564 RepID=A0A8D8TFP6_9HEMI